MNKEIESISEINYSPLHQINRALGPYGTQDVQNFA